MSVLNVVSTTTAWSLLCVSFQGASAGIGADVCQPDVQLFPVYAAVLLGLSGFVTGLFP